MLPCRFPALYTCHGSGTKLDFFLFGRFFTFIQHYLNIVHNKWTVCIKSRMSFQYINSNNYNKEIRW